MIKTNVIALMNSMKFDDQILYAIRQQHKRSLTCYFILISRPWSMEKRIFNLFNCRGR